MVKIGHHKIGACAEIGQNRIRGGWGVKKTQKTSDIIYVRSHTYKIPYLLLSKYITVIIEYPEKNH